MDEAKLYEELIQTALSSKNLNIVRVNHHQIGRFNFDISSPRRGILAYVDFYSTTGLVRVGLRGVTPIDFDISDPEFHEKLKKQLNFSED